MVFLAPVLLLVALYVVGDALGVRAPLLGRSYVVRVPLPDTDDDIDLPPLAD